MHKIFLAGPSGQDPELTQYQCAAAKQRIHALYPEVQVFNACEDLDQAPLRELAVASGFDPDNPKDRFRLLLSELLECSHLYLLPNWEGDDLCKKMHGLAKEVGISPII
jgi:hypothetical protein